VSGRKRLPDIPSTTEMMDGGVDTADAVDDAAGGVEDTAGAVADTGDAVEAAGLVWASADAPISSRDRMTNNPFMSLYEGDFDDTVNY